MPRHIDADEALRMMRNSKQDCPVVDDKRAVWDVAHDCDISCVEATPTADVVPRAEFDKLEYTLIGVMHSVDKWLDGEELNQDEVNRAATMREKTLRIVENAKAEGARESLQEVRQLLLNMVLANSMGETYDLEGKFTELEKKYKGGGDTD